MEEIRETEAGVDFEELGYWSMHTTSDLKTYMVIIPRRVVAEKWTERTGGSDPSEDELRQWLCKNRIYFHAMAFSNSAAASQHWAKDARIRVVRLADESIEHRRALADREWILSTPADFDDKTLDAWRDNARIH